MNEISGPPSSYYNPPDMHEIDDCEDCHKAGCHENIEDWAITDCGDCINLLEESLKDHSYCLKHSQWYCEEVHEGEIVH